MATGGTATAVNVRPASRVTSSALHATPPHLPAPRNQPCVVDTNVVLIGAKAAGMTPAGADEMLGLAVGVSGVGDAASDAGGVVALAGLPVVVGTGVALFPDCDVHPDATRTTARPTATAVAFTLIP